LLRNKVSTVEPVVVGVEVYVLHYFDAVG